VQVAVVEQATMVVMLIMDMQDRVEDLAMKLVQLCQLLQEKP
jgi:hypothetical protein